MRISFAARKRVADGDGEVAGIAAFAVLTYIGEIDGLTVGAHGLGGPQDFVEAVEAAVEGVRAVILVQRVHLAIQREFRSGDAVAVAADGRSKVRRRRSLGVAIERVETHDDVAERAVAIRRLQRNQRRAIGA